MAAFKRVTPPAAEPVAVADARAFLRVAGEEDDALIARLIGAARERVEAETGRALLPQTWRMSADVAEGRAHGAFRVFALRRPPYLSFVEARVAKEDGTSTALALDDVRVDADANAVWLRLGGALLGARAWRPVELVWRCGYADAAAVPEALKTAVLLLVAHAYERRDSLGAPEAATPAGVSALLAPYREVRL
ncbi:hypothetical protein sos41_31110 [Alphaproteobacteria bacterium SO-S41]|nr:hypothetical protein sos41_31110 [Alphaproteobacteria bacterium SO-S41]